MNVFNTNKQELDLFIKKFNTHEHYEIPSPIYSTPPEYEPSMSGQSQSSEQNENHRLFNEIMDLREKLSIPLSYEEPIKEKSSEPRPLLLVDDHIRQLREENFQRIAQLGGYDDEPLENRTWNDRLSVASMLLTGAIIILPTALSQVGISERTIHRVNAVGAFLTSILTVTSLVLTYRQREL